MSIYDPNNIYNLTIDINLYDNNKTTIRYDYNDDYKKCYARLAKKNPQQYYDSGEITYESRAVDWMSDND